MQQKLTTGCHSCACGALLCLHVCVRACAPAGCADLMTLDTMSPQERKRQGYIHELIQTEETYLEDLELVLEVHTRPFNSLSLLLQRCVVFKYTGR